MLKKFVGQKNFYQLIKFVLDTDEAKLKMEQTPLTKSGGIWRLKGKSYAVHATNRDNRRSFTGYLVYFCAVLVAWKSKL